MTIENREKTFIAVGIFFLIIFIFYQYILLPLNRKSDEIDVNILARETDLLKMMELKSEYLNIIQKKKKSHENLNNKKEDFAIFSYLEKLAIDAGIKEKIDHMKPITGKTNKMYEEDSVEVRLKGVSLGSLISFLYNIEHQNNLIKITQIHVKPREIDTAVLDVTFLASYSYLKKKIQG
ncbi:MAG: type II secretion system protein M [Candidatus Firestonebacteria bacterium]|nr:type II secretion system protein M [Candidatus Firestonebacteria bacterium]